MSQPERIAIIGAGLAGLSAARDLLRAGHHVTLYEAAGHSGGLARGFRAAGWDWSLEHFYHHLFESDSDIIGLVEELGIRDKLFFPTPQTSIIHDGQIYPFSNPVDWFKFPGYNIFDFARFGFVGAFLRYTRFWRRLEGISADEWTRRWYGKRIYDVTWRPLLINKFGPHYTDVNMAWLWARLHVRSFKLGYFEGGFQTFVDALTNDVTAAGGVIEYNCPVETIARDGGELQVGTKDGNASFDRVLSTTAPHLLQRMAPGLPAGYLDNLANLKSMGALVLVLTLKQPFMPDGDTYWLNIPATSPRKEENEYPFLGLVEHTNFIDRKHYNGDHILYCGDYLVPDHPWLDESKEQILARYGAALRKVNPAFQMEWIRDSWLFKTRYAQPVPTRNHSGNVLPLRTPLDGLYSANMSQVYPWDRGTNFAVQIGRRAAATMLSDIQP